MALGSSPTVSGRPIPLDVERSTAPVAAKAIADVSREHSVVVAFGGLSAHVKKVGEHLRRALEVELPGKRVLSLPLDIVVHLEPFGPRYADTPDGRRFAAEFGWMVVSAGTGFFRQADPSPVPQTIVQLPAIKSLIADNVLVICLTANGLAFTQGAFGIKERKVEVSLNRDLAAALLAEQLGADLLMLLADVERVDVDWHAEKPTSLGSATVDVLRRVSLAPASIASKVDAACRFVERTGNRAAVGAVAHAAEILDGDSGIQISPA